MTLPKLDPILANCPKELAKIIDECRAIEPDKRPDAAGFMKSLPGLKQCSIFAEKSVVQESIFSGAFEPLIDKQSLPL